MYTKLSATDYKWGPRNRAMLSSINFARKILFRSPHFTMGRIMIRLYVSFGTHCSTRRSPLSVAYRRGSCTTCLATFENARPGAGGYSVGKRKKFATVTPRKMGSPQNTSLVVRERRGERRPAKRDEQYFAG